MVMLRDVTAEAQARETLVSFAGTVAHDLNNPLTVVDGWAETLEELLTDTETVPTEAALPMLQRIRAGVGTMRAFVADLLAHAVARDQTIRGEKVDLGSVVKRVMVTRDRPGSPSPVRGEALPTVWGDRLLLQQLLDNLIGNALKYSRPGVPAEVSVVAEPVTSGWTRVRVCDNGVGIPEDQRELVFRTFHRVDPAVPGGTGLGLSICKRIVERHGGTIHALANPAGHGTCFDLTLPTTQESFESATRTGG
jgi:signal transduction histidine kinase